jgi:hypothetical protein
MEWNYIWPRFEHIPTDDISIKVKINHSFQINSLLKITPHTHTPFLGELFCGVLKTITNNFYERIDLKCVMYFHLYWYLQSKCDSFFQTKLVSFGRWVVFSCHVWKKNQNRTLRFINKSLKKIFVKFRNSKTNTDILFPIKEPFRAEQLTKNLIQWLWIDYIDWNMTTYMYYETNKSKFNHTIDIVIVAFEERAP